MTHHEFLALEERQLGLQAAWRRFFERYDLMVCRSCDGRVPARPLRRRPRAHRAVLADDAGRRRARAYINGLQWPGLVTVANLPATAIQTGRTVDGMPTGLQAVGPFGEDRTPLRFATLAERALVVPVPSALVP